MRRFSSIFIVLILILMIIIVILLNQNSHLKRAENTLFDVAIDNAIIDSRIYSINEALRQMNQEKILYVNENGFSVISRDLQRISFSYAELYRYYVGIYRDDAQMSYNIQDIFQDFSVFFDVLAENSEYDLLNDNREEKVYVVSLENEPFIEIEIISTIVNDLEDIRSEIYKDKATNDREAWKTLVEKNGEYVQTAEVQKQLESIQQFIKMWSE